MEAVNLWQFHNLNQDFAIRQFCPARAEEERGSISDHDHQQMAVIFSPNREYYTNDQLAPSHHDEEDEQIVDDFFNVECFQKDNGNVVVEEEEAEYDHNHQLTFPDHFQDLEGFSISSDIFLGGDGLNLMLIDELGDALEVTSSSEEGSEVNSDHMAPAAAEDRVDQGLNLVHLLLACAEAVGCRDSHLAHSILNQIWPYVAPWGDSLMRVSYCFALGFKSRISLLQNVNPNGILFLNGAGEKSLISREDKIEAFHLLHQATPYISFGFMAANDAICQAAKGKELLHIIDIGSPHHLQWPSLIRNLASRTEGPPKLVRITSVIEDQDDPFVDLEVSMKVVVEEASSLGVVLEFKIINRPVTPLLLTKENLDLREGEALFFNSIMHLHKFVKESRGSLKTILLAVKKLGPVLLTVVEQDANHNGPFFLGRFLESLHYYSAIFDSLEACLPRDSPQRMKIEKLYFAEEIRNIVAYEGSDRIERHERADQWRRQLGRAGYQAVGLKSMSQVRMMLAAYGCDGYTLATEKGCLLLGWKGRPIMLASAWQVNNV